MQGLWKDKRKHFLKDKRSFLSRKMYGDSDSLVKRKGVVYDTYDSFELVSEETVKTYESAPCYKVTVDLNSSLFPMGVKTFSVYELNGCCYDIYSGLYMFPASKCQKIDYIGLKHLDKKVIKKSFYGFSYKRRVQGVKSDIWLYGKKAPYWEDLYFYPKKWAKTKANRKDRRREKDFCNNSNFEDWDNKVVKTHATSKSILWDVY